MDKPARTEIILPHGGISDEEACLQLKERVNRTFIDLGNLVRSFNKSKNTNIATWQLISAQEYVLRAISERFDKKFNQTEVYLERLDS